MSSSIQSTGNSTSAASQGADPAKKIAQEALQSAEKNGEDPKQLSEQIRNLADASQGVGKGLNVTC